MKTVCITSLLTASLSIIAMPALAVSPPVIPLPPPPENHAVNISIGSIGGKLDGAALRAARQIVGYGIASGVVDNFTVYSPRPGAIPKEGGLSACAEAGFGISNAKFKLFIKDLQAIKPKAGTVYDVTPVPNCAATPAVVCTMEVKICPDGVTAVGRSGPFCAFEPCPTSVKK